MICDLTHVIATGVPQHPDMAAFVGAVLAMLLCATFLDAPKRYFKTWLSKRGENFIHNSKKALLDIQATASSLAEQLEDIEADFKESSAKVEYLIRWCNKWMYTPSAFICGFLALTELYLGKTQEIGYWNLLLVIPFILFLLPIVIYLVWTWFILRVERWSFEKRLHKKQRSQKNSETEVIALIEKLHK